ncbi:hypothetical protein ACHAPJ_010272 [Fusarium lateritium]
MANIIHGDGGRRCGRPRKLTPPRQKDTLIVSLKLRPKILAETGPHLHAFANTCRSEDRKAPHESLRKELDRYQLNSLNQLIKDERSELERLSLDYVRVMDKVNNYERVYNMHCASLEHDLADAYESRIATCEPESNDDKAENFLKDDIITLRAAVQSWRYLLLKAKQDASTKKHQMSIVNKNLKMLEGEQSQLTQKVKGATIKATI